MEEEDPWESLEVDGEDAVWRDAIDCSRHGTGRQQQGRQQVGEAKAKAQKWAKVPEKKKKRVSSHQ